MMLAPCSSRVASLSGLHFFPASDEFRQFKVIQIRQRDTDISLALPTQPRAREQRVPFALHYQFVAYPPSCVQCTSPPGLGMQLGAL